MAHPRSPHERSDMRGLTRMSLRSSGLRLLLLVLALVAAAPVSAQEKVAVGVLRFVSSGALFVAVERGYFRQEGIEVDLKFFDAAQPIAVAVVTGDVDFGLTAFTAGLFNLAGKGGLKVIAAQAKEQKGYEGNAILASNAAWDRGLRRVDDLKGHSLAITQVGSSFHYQIGQIARVKGFDLNSVALKPLQSLANMAAALKGSQVDAIITAPHLARQLLANGDAKLLGWYSDLDEYQFGALFTAPKTIDTRRVTVEKFVRAYQKGAAAFSAAMLKRDDSGNRKFDGASHALAAEIAKYVYPAEPADKAVGLIEASTYYVDPQARLDVGDIHGQIAWYKRHGMVDASVDPAALLDLSFVTGHTNVPR
jgi:NitT/TauT family transport system substrate-binding protein